MFAAEAQDERESERTSILREVKNLLTAIRLRAGMVQNNIGDTDTNCDQIDAAVCRINSKVDEWERGPFL